LQFVSTHIAQSRDFYQNRGLVSGTRNRPRIAQTEIGRWLTEVQKYGNKMLHDVAQDNVEEPDTKPTQCHQSKRVAVRTAGIQFIAWLGK
jgi:hypothetical protein